MIGRLRRLRAEVLGLNRRNHAYLFAYNPRERHGVVDDKRATKDLKGRLGDQLDEIAVFSLVAVAVFYIAAASCWFLL